MLGFTPYRCYYYLWKFITPILLLVLMLASFIQMVMTPASYNAWIQEEVSKHLGPRSPGARDQWRLSHSLQTWNELKANKRLQRRRAQGRNGRRVQASFNPPTINRMCSLRRRLFGRIVRKRERQSLQDALVLKPGRRVCLT